MSKVVFSLLVDNEAGVLSRISGLFSRRNYNIESITAGPTTTPGVTRLTVIANGEPEVLDQIEKQVSKLVDVRSIRVLPAEDSVLRELILVKVAVTSENRDNVIHIAEIFRAKIVDISRDSMMLEMTGVASKINAFLGMLEEYPIMETARTGTAGLSRGIAY